MIGAFVCGGLGNQMFQYAAGRALALRHKTGLQLDLSSYQSRRHFETSRSFELHNLAIEVEPASPLTSVGFRLARRSSRTLRRLSGWDTKREQFISHYNAAFEALPDDSYIYGYWQSWRYFSPVADRIRKELQPRVALSAESSEVERIIKATNSLSLHVRRGDYVTSKSTNNFHGVLDLDFYASAVSHVQERVSNVQAYVFSDDLDWCKEALASLPLPMTFVDVNRGEDSWQDLFLMAACRHNVVANSSFSWWGAWLGDDADQGHRIVIAPKKWFLGTEIDVADRCPPTWTIL